MKVIVVTLVVLLGVLQYRLWAGDGSVAEVWSLKKELEAQQKENAALRERNRRLEAEVVDLKEGTEVIEDRARRELGMSGKNETFFQIVER